MTLIQKGYYGLSHLFTTVFLYCFANFMVVPAITDVTMAALCPGKDECSLAIYLTGAQQAIVGLGSLVVMPLVGNLSDTYGRKVMLTIPVLLSVFPLAILAYSRTRYYFYAYYVLKTLISMAEGSVQFLAFAYVADNVDESRRGSVFAVMSGFASSSFVLGSFFTSFLSTSSTFQVAAAMSLVTLFYTLAFLPESNLNTTICGDDCTDQTDCLLQKSPCKKWKLFKSLPSLDDTICLLRTSPTFSKAAVVAFFSTVADVGLNASLMYYLKAQFHFNKDQFADLMIIAGMAGSLSQLIIMPVLSPLMGEEKMLSIGLFFSFANMILYSIAWAPWVPYAAAVITIVATFAMPCLRAIASKQTGPNEQGGVLQILSYGGFLVIGLSIRKGKAQGCITGICSFANIVSPLAFSPLAAIFLSDNAPFHFPGFSIMCSGFVAMIAFTQSIMMKPPPIKDSGIANNSRPGEILA